MKNLKKRFAYYLLRHPYISLCIRTFVQPRHIRVYGVGAAKTGTQSIYKIFAKNYRSAHEPGFDEAIDHISIKNSDNFNIKYTLRWLHNRDRSLWFECESSHAIAWFSDLLVKEFPDAKFILTVRDCYSWLGSVINQHYNNDQATGHLKKLRDIYHKTDGKYETEILKKLDLYTLDGYLSYWARHNDFVLNAIPQDRLLVIPTQHIKTKLELLLILLGFKQTSLIIPTHIPIARKFKTIFQIVYPKS